MRMREFKDPSVQAAYAQFPDEHREQLLKLRELVCQTAEEIDLPDGLQETLKWGEPSYLPNKPRVGTTVRLSKHNEDCVGMYFNCQTMLVERFRSMFGDELSYSKNRAILFETTQALPQETIKKCLRQALLYHVNKRN